MANGESLSEEDLAFLKRAEGFRGAFEKINQAKKLIAEARAEMRAIVNEGARPKGAKQKPTHVQFAAEPVEPAELTHDQQLVITALSDTPTVRAHIVDATLLRESAVRRVLEELRKLKLAKTVGTGRGTKWVRV